MTPKNQQRHGAEKTEKRRRKTEVVFQLVGQLGEIDGFQ